MTNPDSFPGVDVQSETLTENCPPWGGQAAGNLAYQKQATQKTTAFDGDPGRAVDGNWDGYYYDGSVTHTDYEYFPWWKVDLQSSQFISFMEIFNRTDCCSDRLYSLVIGLSDDDVNWTNSFWVSPDTSQPRKPTRVNIDASARYVTVMLWGPGYLSLAEVHVFGAGTDRL